MQRLIRSGAAALAALLLFPLALPAAAATTAVPSGLTLSSNPWAPAEGRLRIGFQLSAASGWQLNLVDACSGQKLRKLDGQATAAGLVEATLDGTVAPVVSDGSYLVQVSTVANTATPLTGFLRVASVSKSATYVDGLCANASRVVVGAGLAGDIAATAVQAASSYPESKTVLLVAAGKQAALAAVGAVVARQRGWPLLLTESTKLSLPTKQELKRRAVTRVMLLGSEKLISKTVFTSLRKLGYAVSRKSADSAAGLAKAMYQPAPTGAAVFANFAGSRKSLLLATAYANATGGLLLPLAGGGAKAGNAQAAALKLQTRVVVASPTEVSDATIKALPDATRVSASDLEQATLALARTLPPAQSTLQLVSPSASIRLATVTSQMQPQVLLAVGKDGLSLTQRQWLNSRGDLTSVVVTQPSNAVSDLTTTAVGQLLAARGAPTALPPVTAAELGPLTAPANFAFSGSGNGHGIGMSQWGAYQLAVNGLSASEILGYYYPTTTVAPVPSDADIWVSLYNRIPTVKVGLQAIAGSTPTMQLAATTNGVTQKVTVTAANNVAISYVASTNKVRFAFSGTDAPSLNDANAVTITWSGTRLAGALGDQAGVATVATSAKSRTYRFGSLRISAATANNGYSAGLQVVNRVRLLDEYLYGIGEVSSSWPAAALQAQAIAARSYVYSSVYKPDGTLSGRSSNCDCDVYDDTRDQNYVGWSKLAESAGPKWKAAVDATVVDATQGLAVVSESQVVTTFYSAASGGFTQNIEDAWGTAAKPYYAAVPDPFALQPAGAASVARWSPRVRTNAVVAAAFGLSAVATLDFSDRFISGAMRTVTATAPDGTTATISGTAFRKAVVSDTGALFPSTWVWRVPIRPSAESTAATADLLADVWMGYAKAPGNTSTEAVVTTRAVESGADVVAIASAYAGVRGAALLTAASAGDANRVRDILLGHGVKTVQLVGAVDPAIATALAAAGLSISQTNARDAAALALELGLQVGLAGGAVIASATDTQALPLAVSLATRLRRPLLLMQGGALSPATSLALGQSNAASVIAVGAADQLPDAALAGLPAQRLNTADRAVASVTAARLASGVVRAIVVAGPDTDPELAMVAASNGFPLLYLDPQTQIDNIAWLRRQSLAAAVLDVGAAPQLVDEIRRA